MNELIISSSGFPIMARVLGDGAEKAAARYRAMSNAEIVREFNYLRHSKGNFVMQLVRDGRLIYEYIRKMDSAGFSTLERSLRDGE